MERSAATDDLVTCPSCREREHLLIRWIPEIDHRIHERTDVGCARCELWRSAKEDRWAFAEWNSWACDEWIRLGHEVPHTQLYRLLVEEMRHEMAAQHAAATVAKYLLDEVASRCAWKSGDRFKSLAWPKGMWSVRSIEAVYGTNTGPFCILKCREVLRSGILGDSTHDFWDHGTRLKRLAPLWKPRTWRQVVVGDACVLAGKHGVVMFADPSSRRAVVAVEGEQLAVQRLNDLLVPVARMEE